MPATARAQSNRTLLAALLATVLMLFTAFLASYFERRGTTGTWTRVALPGLVWGNTLVMLASSFFAELARRRGGGRWLGLTIALGILFLAGQAVAWMELRAAGVFLPTNAYAAFFYLLSAVHGIHVVAGLIALGLALSRPRIRGLCIGFWHCMGFVWLYVFLVLKLF